MTYADLLQILEEAEERVANHPDERVKQNSRETVALVFERLEREGLTRTDLERDARR